VRSIKSAAHCFSTCLCMCAHACILNRGTSAHAHARLHAYARERERESMCVRYVFVCVREREYTPLGIRGRSLRAVNVAAYLSLSASLLRSGAPVCVCKREREGERESIQTDKQTDECKCPPSPPSLLLSSVHLYISSPSLTHTYTPGRRASRSMGPASEMRSVTCIYACKTMK
jgi:hypothetical protein